MKRNTKRLGELLGKLTITEAAELEFTGEEWAALLTAQQKMLGLYNDLIHNTERAMAGEGALPDVEQAAAVLGYIHVGLKIHAIKLIRRYSACTLVAAKGIADEVMVKISEDYKPSDLLSWLVGEMRRTGGT